jgi:hypothetical protein
MSAEATPSFDNEDMADAIADQHVENKQQEREDHAQAKSDKNSILEAFDEETIHIRLKSWRIECHTLDGETEDWLEELGVRFSDVDEETELSKERQDEYLDSRDRTIEILAEHSLNDDYDETFWRKIPKRYRQESLESLASGGEEGRRAGN